MGVRETMVKEWGPEALKRPVKAGELYEIADMVTAAIRSLRERIDAIEGKKGIKPRVRVQAGSTRDDA